MSTRQKQPDAATTVQISSSWRDSGEQDLAFHRAGRERSEQDAPPRRHHYEEANGQTLPTAVIKTSLRMREKTVEF